MKITENVILDLLPLYYAGEVSEDSRQLVEKYLAEHPEFAEKYSEDSLPDISTEMNESLEPEEEMKTLQKTQKLLKLRTTLLILAIFLTCIPFSFGDVSWNDRGVHWLWEGFPEGAVMVGFVAAICWLAYFRIQQRLRVTAL